MNVADGYAWAAAFLGENGYQIIQAATPFRVKPWAHVARFQTARGWIYFKQSAAPFPNEIKLLNFFGTMPEIAPLVPQPLATHPELNVLLLPNYGMPLREILKNTYNVAQVTALMTSYAKLQQACIPHVSALLALGLPDWRPTQLPNCLDALLDFMATTKTDTALLQQAKAVRPKLMAILETMAATPLPCTLEHADFHDNNVLHQNGRLLINDWADAGIGHPFFSLLSWLGSAAKHHGLAPAAAATIKAAYLDAWADYIAPSVATELLQKMQNLRALYWAIGFQRAVACDGFADYPDYQNHLADALREFVTNMEKISI